MRIFGGCVHRKDGLRCEGDVTIPRRVIEWWWFGAQATVAVDNVSILPGDLNCRKPAALLTEAASKHWG